MFGFCFEALLSACPSFLVVVFSCLFLDFPGAVVHACMHEAKLHDTRIHDPRGERRQTSVVVVVCLVMRLL